MRVSAWKGATYGIRVGKQNAKKYFQRNWKSIEVEIDGEVHEFSLSDTFWGTCPELRGVVIERWLRKNGLLPWTKGKPPHFTLAPLAGKRFKLSF
jgi:hypothetical protein